MSRFIIDTDTAGDDVTSLLFGLLWPGVALQAITTVAGNVPLPLCNRNALYTVEMAGRAANVPVYAGCDRPFLRPLVTCEYVHGQDGMGDSHFPLPGKQLEKEHAAVALVDLINRYPGEVEIMAQAPLTNIATAYMLDPSIVHKVKRLWVMGGANNYLGNVTAAAEFNFYVDPEAAKMVFRAGFPVTMVGWELCVRYGTLGEAGIQRIQAMDNPISRFYLQVNRAALRFNIEQGGLMGISHPDSLMMAMAIDNSLIKRSARYHVDVECNSDLTRGYSRVDVLGMEGLEPNTEVCLEVDADRFQQMLFSLLQQEPGGRA